MAKPHGHRPQSPAPPTTYSPPRTIPASRLQSMLQCSNLHEVSINELEPISILFLALVQNPRPLYIPRILTQYPYVSCIYKSHHTPLTFYTVIKILSNFPLYLIDFITFSLTY